jgi:two-component system, chemotaxis family, sensor kinase Cph1
MCALHGTAEDNRWNEIGLGVHICSIYRGSEDQLRPIIPFFSEGYTQNQKCMYIFDEHQPQNISSRIDDHYKEHIKEEGERQLQMIPYGDIYTQGNSFDPDRVINLFKDAVVTSLKEGYSGVRAAGEMSWVYTSGTSLESLIDYEQKLNEFYPTQKVIGICEFDADKFPEQILIEMIRMHPYVIVEGKLYENKYLYTDPNYIEPSTDDFKATDYQTILSILTDQSEPEWG